jgi:putative DNA primase/helicase
MSTRAGALPCREAPARPRLKKYPRQGAGRQGRMHETEFYDALKLKGFDPGEVIADGHYHRFDVKRGDKSGYYNLDADGHGVFGSWKTREQFIFRSGNFQEMTEAERAEASAKYKAEQRRRKIEKQESQQKVAIEARSIWEGAANAVDHPYLIKKKISARGLRVDKSGALLVPIWRGKKLVNLQRVTVERKLFLPGGEKSGCWGVVDGSTDIVYIAEGYATAATISECTGCICYVALDAGNLGSVARNIRDRLGVGARIVICADNDQWTEIKGERVNVGREAAEKAAVDIYADLKYPDFPSDDPEKRTDWNDFFVSNGSGATAAALVVQKNEVEDTRENQLAPIEDPEFDLDENGRPRATIENMRRLMDKHQVTLRYNVIKKQEEILIPGEIYSLDNAQNAAYAKVVSLCKNVEMSTGSLGDYLTYLCDKQHFNPVVTWVMSRPWDGRSRLAEFFDTIKSPDKTIRDLILTRWMVSAVASAFSPQGLATRGVLVFQGEQYLGKTSWFKKLVPAELDVRVDGYILRLDDKDNIFQCLTNWLVELGELEATFKKSDVAQLKAFIPKDRDVLRKPYARKESYFGRRTVFFASVNIKEFLFDETGNSRFWTIPTQAIIYNHDIDMQQVWAEVYALHLDGEPYIMSGEEMVMINAANEDFMGSDYHEELVARKLDWDQFGSTNGAGNWKTVTELCAMLGVINPKQVDLNRISKAVKKYNGGAAKRGGHGIKLLLVPAERTSFHVD